MKNQVLFSLKNNEKVFMQLRLVLYVKLDTGIMQQAVIL